MAGKLPVSPLAPASFPDLPVIEGASFATAAAGVRYAGRTDVMLCRLAPGSTVAGVFTTSATRSSPVLDCQAKLAAPAESDRGAAILVNSGNANAFTGRAGDESVEAVCAGVADVLDLPASRVFTASTGVIGERLAHDRIVAALQTLSTNLSEDAGEDAARAIMTTDTYPKGAGRVIETEAGPIRIAGFAKGSGMIAPDMATMLVYIFTDAAVPQPLLQEFLAGATPSTFNAITVDGDTSTSDSLMLAATGRGSARIEDAASATGTAFAEALHAVMLDLAHQVVRDGEGATKFVEVAVSGARDDADAKRIALSIANSPLVKTAIAGEDPNWGRVVMAVGKSGAEADRDALAIRFGDILVAEKGWVSPDYSEEAAAAYMKGQDLRIAVDLGLASGAFTAWTCDLTHAYIDINADYRS
ncbi:bifunctional glutamate N-acetyltransferase/amino-acid acetyltransferase ArgJ [Tropicimonas sp. IMCC34011]|uniref:bifunctional glutamate N-acetyltransferase/amino-acid acetyltransferase ArgJ n=1 Tax=Tropicimonas sp. IMCC34011 TaxID=2248759 RepID=UPI000E26A4D4|nr:bifunctional glutamate N-acetyltransferase/amino-acid acetyltransferase ArgJ [Tropicimonas sp. IMCC34011]